VNDFLEYYEKEWVFSNPSGWFEGKCEGYFVPSTNNALESANGKIKSKHTLENRQPLGRFLDSFVKYVKRFATADYKQFEFESSLTGEVWSASYSYLISKPKCWSIDAEEYLLSNDQSVDDAVMEAYQARSGCSVE
jgi:hypothetical protein